MKGEAMLRQAARVVGQRRQAYGDPAALDGGGRRTLVDHPRPAGHRRRRWCSA